MNDNDDLLEAQACYETETAEETIEALGIEAFGIGY